MPVCSQKLAEPLPREAFQQLVDLSLGTALQQFQVVQDYLNNLELDQAKRSKIQENLQELEKIIRSLEEKLGTPIFCEKPVEEWTKNFSLQLVLES